MKPIIVIPARMQSKRFPGKPMVLINGKPMLQHVIEKAILTKIGKVLVACCDDTIVKLLEDIGVEYIVTNKKLISGTDRVQAALKEYDKKKKYSLIINLQADLPNIVPKTISQLYELAKMPNIQIATLASKIIGIEKTNDPNVVKAVISFTKKNIGKAIYFSRSRIPYGSNFFYEHIGLYAFKRDVLDYFVTLKPSKLEITESLEQLRALENGINIDIRVVDDAPVGIDTFEDLNKLKENKVEKK